MKKKRVTKNTKNLFEAILCLDNFKEAENFFRDLCSVEEIRAMSERWQIVKLLSQSLSYREISETLGVSTTTVSRVSLCYREGTGAYSSVLKKINSHNNSAKVFRKG